MNSTPVPLSVGDFPLSDRPAAVVQVFGDRPLQTEGDLLALAFAPDQTLWSVEDPGLLRHWDPVQMRLLDWYLLDDPATNWTFAPGCCWVASGSDELSLWDVPTGELLATQELAELLGTPEPTLWVTALAFDPTAKLLATG